MDTEKPPYHEIIGTAVETFKLGWQALGKFVAAHTLRRQLPPPPDDSERSMVDY